MAHHFYGTESQPYNNLLSNKFSNLDARNGPSASPWLSQPALTQRSAAAGLHNSGSQPSMSQLGPFSQQQGFSGHARTSGLSQNPNQPALSGVFRPGTSPCSGKCQRQQPAVSQAPASAACAWRWRFQPSQPAAAQAWLCTRSVDRPQTARPATAAKPAGSSALMLFGEMDSDSLDNVAGDEEEQATEQRHQLQHGGDAMGEGSFAVVGGASPSDGISGRSRESNTAASGADDPKDRVTIKIVKESLDAQRMVSRVVDELKSKRDKEEDPQFWIDGLDDDDDGIEVQVEQIMATVYSGTVAKHFHGNYSEKTAASGPFTLLTFNGTWKEVKPKKKQQQAASLLQQQQAASLQQQQQQSEGEFEDEFGRGDDLVDHKKRAALILLKSGDLSGAAALLSEAAGEQPSDQRQLQKLDLLAAAGGKVAALADKKRKREKKDAPNHGEAAMLSNASKTGRKPFKPPRIGKAAARDDTAAAAAAAVPCSGLSTRGRQCKASQKAAAGAECDALLDDYELAGTSCSSRSDSEVEDNGDTDSDA
ncbi:hypothetical protein COO60DRAFT_1625650 [Scenedesmus sp. NREL 46B-D3]|nr:hypothetical protein COO60DRAFT_1625650 [Scenedesmus sp. NREL 46B-D3]